MISPLDQLYLETTSKEDLLAEINDQKRRAELAISKLSALRKEVAALAEKNNELASVNDKITKELLVKRSLVCSYRKRLGLSDAGGVKKSVMAMLADGLNTNEIISRGYKKSTVQRYRRMYNSIKKAAQSN